MICENCHHDWNPDLVDADTRQRQDQVLQDTGTRVCPICSQDYVQESLKAKRVREI